MLEWSYFPKQRDHGSFLNDSEHVYRWTSSVAGHSTFPSTRDGVPEWAVSRQMNWSWWSIVLATTITISHSPIFPQNMGYKSRVHRREKLYHRIFDAARRMYLEFQISLLPDTTKVSTRLSKCVIENNTRRKPCSKNPLCTHYNIDTQNFNNNKSRGITMLLLMS